MMIDTAGGRRRLLHTLAALAAGSTATLAHRASAQPRRRLRFGVGPFLPTPDDSRRAFAPLFAHLAKQLGASEHTLDVTTDWAGLAVAMATGNLDAAWMGPWGYVLAHHASGCQAIATVRYDDRPVYNAIIVARPGLPITTFPDDTRGLSMSFADSGSTSG